MAVRYAVATGNWSSTSTWNGGTLPTSADDVYANGFTVTIDQNVTVLSIRTTAQSPAIAGGGFILNSGLTLNATASGIIAGSSICLTYSSTSGLSTINGNIFGSSSGSNFQGLNHAGNADLVINGNIASGSTYWGMTKSSTGTLTIIGNVSVTSGNNNNRGISNTGTGTINITGNVTGQIGGIGHGHGIVNAAVCTINITGSVFAGTGGPTNLSTGITNSVNNVNIYVTGNVYSNTSNAGITTGSLICFLNIIGTISSNFQNPTLNDTAAVISTSSTSINIFSGPFISAPYGTFPYQCVRMHLIPSVSNYIKFRDETTNGALPPGAIAPATRMVAPASVVDAPAPANVRFGTIYANGSQTGTCKIPATTAVAAGVGVDNTVGSAVLSPGDVWNALVSTMNTSGSIGERLKNASTVQTTGEQIASIN